MQRFDNVAKIIIVNFCTRFHLYIHIYALVLLQRGLSLIEISTIESVVTASIFLAEVPTGVIADRIGRKWSIVLSIFFLMMGELIFLFSRSFSLYLLIGVFTGIGFAFASGATEALVYDSLPQDNRDSLMKRAMSRIGSMGSIAFFISPLIGSVIVGELAPERVSIAIALTVVALFIGVLVAMTLHEPASEWHAERPNTLDIFRSGMREFRRNRRFQWILLLVVLTTPFGATLVTTLAPPHLAQNGVSHFGIALTLSLGNLLAAFTQRLAPRIEQWLGERRAIILLTILPSIWYFLLAVVAGPVASWTIITLMYGTGDMKNPLFSAYQNRVITGRNRATLLSMVGMFLNLSVAIRAPLYVALATVSMPLAFLTMGGVIAVAALVLRVDKLPSVAVEQIEPESYPNPVSET